MKAIYKTTLSVILAISMIITLGTAMPMTVNAASGQTTTLTFQNNSSGNGWSASNGILTLTNFEWVTSAATAVSVPSSINKIQLNGANIIRSTTSAGPDSYGLKADGPLTITGSGTLVAEGGDSDSNSYGMMTKAITFDTGFTGTANAIAGSSSGSNSKGLKSTALTIQNGNVIACGGNGSSNSMGMETTGIVTISGGNVCITGSDVSTNSLCYGIYASEPVNISGGNVVITSGSAKSSSGIVCLGLVSVTGGMVQVTSGTGTNESRGVYSDGVTVTGGVLSVMSNTAPTSRGINLFTGNVPISVTGGTVIASSLAASGTSFSAAPTGYAGMKTAVNTDATSPTDWTTSSASGSEVTTSHKYVCITNATDVRTDTYNLNGSETWTNKTLVTLSPDALVCDGASTITLSGTNNLICAYKGASEPKSIYSETADVTFTGSGTLNIVGGTSSGFSNCGIGLDQGTMRVNTSCAVNIFTGAVTNSSSASSNKGIDCISVIIDGTLNTFGGYSTDGYSIGILTEGITIGSGATLNGFGGVSQNNSFGIKVNDTSTISGGKVTAVGGVSKQDSYGLDFAKKATISDGTVMAISTIGDLSAGLCLQGTGADACEISGGKVYGIGGRTTERTPDDYSVGIGNMVDTKFTGGHIIGIGGNGGTSIAFMSPPADTSNILRYAVQGGLSSAAMTPGAPTDWTSNYLYLSFEVEPSITLGAQTGTLTSGTAGSATYSITTGGFATAPVFTSSSLKWYTAVAGETETSAPAGVTASFNGNTLTLRTTATATAGTYYFDIKSDTTRSNVATLVIGPSNYVPVTNITGVTTRGVVGTPLTLSGTVNPSTANKKTITWSVKSKGNTGAVINNGKLSFTGSGTATLKATVKDGSAKGTDYTQTFTITVSYPISTGQTFTVSGYNYKITSVTNSKKTVTFTGLTAAKKRTATSVNLANTVKIKGVSFKITEVGKNALKNNTKITKVTIGNNVKVIGASAFFKCTSLKTVSIGTGVTEIKTHAFCYDKKIKTLTIKSKNLKTIGTPHTFNQVKATMKVPSSKLSAYKRLFARQQGVSGMKFKKI